MKYDDMNFKEGYNGLNRYPTVRTLLYGLNYRSRWT